MGLQGCAGGGEGGWVGVKQWVKERDQLEYMAPESLFTLPSLVPRHRGERGSGLASPYPTCVLTNSNLCCVFQVVQEKHAIIQRGWKDEWLDVSTPAY